MAIRRIPIAFVVLAALIVGGCGGTSPVDTGDVTTPPPTTTEPPSGPTGPIDYDGVGPARQGMSSDEVIAAFGQPVSQDVVPGCPLDSNAKKQLVLKWDLPGGQLSLTFTTGDEDSLLSTFTDAPDLETVDGISVGDTYEDLSHASQDLQGLTLGAEATPDQGFWFVERSPTERITYDVDKGKVARILSGDTPACE